MKGDNKKPPTLTNFDAVKNYCYWPMNMDVNMFLPIIPCTPSHLYSHYFLIFCGMTLSPVLKIILILIKPCHLLFIFLIQNRKNIIM